MELKVKLVLHFLTRWLLFFIIVFNSTTQAKQITNSTESESVCTNNFNCFILTRIRFNHSEVLEKLKFLINKSGRNQEVEPMLLIPDESGKNQLLMMGVRDDSTYYNLKNSNILRDFLLQSGMEVIAPFRFLVCIDMMNYKSDASRFLILMEQSTKSYHKWRENLQTILKEKNQFNLAYHSIFLEDGDSSKIVLGLLTDHISNFKEWINSPAFKSNSYDISTKIIYEYYQLNPNSDGSLLSHIHSFSKFIDTSHTITEFPPEMIFVQGGSFFMGLDSGFCDAQPCHSISLDNFYIGKYEITQSQWFQVMKTNPSRFENCPDCPVEQVSYDDCQEFILRLNQLSGKKFRLPTEAEWEYAAQGGNKKAQFEFSGGNELNLIGWQIENSNFFVHPVGRLNPNELGIYDMTGNVWEWCSDFYSSSYYSEKIKENPKGPENGTFVSLRGGSWNSQVDECKIKTRNKDYSYNRGFRTGLRLALSKE